jgi:hypothetical protein
MRHLNPLALAWTLVYRLRQVLLQRWQFTLETRFQAVYKRQCDRLGVGHLRNVNDLALDSI